MDRIPRNDAFLDALASRMPTPGGGSAAAHAGALGCALARMVAAYSQGPNVDAAKSGKVSDIAKRLETADRMFRRFVVEDAEAYERLTEATKRGKADPAVGGEQAAAADSAIAVPMGVAATAAESLGVVKELLVVANPRLVSDLGVAAVLIEAAAHGAAYMVYVNAESLTDAEKRQKMEHQIDRMLAHASKTHAEIKSALDDVM